MTHAVEPNLHERVLRGGVEGDVAGWCLCVVEVGCCGSSQDSVDGWVDDLIVYVKME